MRFDLYRRVINSEILMKGYLDLRQNLLGIGTTFNHHMSRNSNHTTGNRPDM